MNCKIKLFIGGNLIEMEVPSLPSSYSELKLLLTQNKVLEEFNDYVKIAVNLGKIVSSMSLDLLKQNGRTIPNTSAEALKTYFSEVEFPEIELSQIPILLVNHYKTEDSQLLFGIVELDGDTVYILDNNLHHIRQFSAYLKLKSLVEEGNLLDNLKGEIVNTLEACAKASGYTSIKDMILQYLNHKSIFREYRTEDGKSVFSTLNKILTELNFIAPKKIKFEDPTVNEFFIRLTWNFKEGNKLENIEISTKEFYELVLMKDEKISKVLPDKFDKFLELLKSKYPGENFENFFGEGENKLDLIIQYLNSLEPWLNLGLISYDKNKINLKQLFPSVGRVYGIGYDTIKSMTFKNFKGWYIFEKDGKFYPSRNFITPSTRSLEFSSMEEASNFIDEIILQEELFNDLDIKLGRQKATNKYFEGDLIRVKNYEVSTSYLKEEYREIKTLQDFYEKFTDPDIQSLIQNALDATLFLRKLSEFKKTPSLEEQTKIALDIYDADYLYYYVEKSFDDKEDKIKYLRIIPAKGIQLEDFKSNHKLPVTMLFDAILKVYGEKFGMDIEILSNEEIEKNYKVVNAKAFIIGNKIVLNSTLASSEDIFHEYSHIILGYLKMKNLLGYRNLMESVWKLLPSYVRNSVNSQYQYLPLESKMEEGFVYYFGLYIVNNKLNNEELNNIFKESEKDLSKGAAMLFDGETDIKKIYGEKLRTILGLFNKEVANIINTDQDFLSFSKSNDFFLLRKKANWLEKQIEDKKIIEKC